MDAAARRALWDAVVAAHEEVTRTQSATEGTRQERIDNNLKAHRALDEARQAMRVGDTMFHEYLAAYCEAQHTNNAGKAHAAALALSGLKELYQWQRDDWAALAARWSSPIDTDMATILRRAA